MIDPDVLDRLGMVHNLLVDMSARLPGAVRELKAAIDELREEAQRAMVAQPGDQGEQR